MHEQNDRLNVILLDYRLKTLTVNCWLQILLHIEPKPGALILTLPYIDAFMDIKKFNAHIFSLECLSLNFPFINSVEAHIRKYSSYPDGVRNLFKVHKSF